MEASQPLLLPQAWPGCTRFLMERNAGITAEIQRLKAQNAKIWDEVEAIWRLVIALKQRTFLGPAFRKSDLGERVLERYQHIYDISRNDSHTFHRVACKLVKEFEDWVDEYKKEIVAVE